MSDAELHPQLLRLTAAIVSAHVSHSLMPAEAFPGIIQPVYDALSRASTSIQSAPAAIRLEPGMPVKKSVFPDHLAGLEDGKKLNMVKRHRPTSYGMTPGECHEKGEPPDNYPMVAQDYAAR